MDLSGIAPETPPCKGGILLLDYRPSFIRRFVVVPLAPETFCRRYFFVSIINIIEASSAIFKNIKSRIYLDKIKLKNLGGDPSAGSPTDTLWRLNLPCLTKDFTKWSSPLQNSVGLTGGECKRQGHIHRSLLTNDYYEFQRHEGGLQPSIWTETDARGLASPFGVAAHWICHCRARVAQGIRDVLT